MGIPNIDASIEYFESFDGTRIATASWGDRDAPTVILSNGICCSDTHWTFLQPVLVENGYRVVFFDYRGHNRSSVPANPNEVTLPAHARDLWAAADYNQVTNAVLIGHSMGVQTLFEAYRQHPGRVQGIVALAGPFEYPLDHLYMTPIGAIAAAAFELTWRHTPSVVRSLWQAGGLDTRAMITMAHLIGLVSRSAPNDLMDEYFKVVANLDPLLVLKFFQAMQMHSARDIVMRCDAPVLQIAGARDVLTPLPLQRELASLLADVRFEIYGHATHTLPIDQPERVNTRILGFLEELKTTKKFSGRRRKPAVRAARKPAVRSTAKPRKAVAS